MVGWGKCGCWVLCFAVSPLKGWRMSYQSAVHLAYNYLGVSLIRCAPMSDVGCFSIKVGVKGADFDSIACHVYSTRW
jgi:hypothetical protein